MCSTNGLRLDREDIHNIRYIIAWLEHSKKETELNRPYLNDENIQHKVTRLVELKSKASQELKSCVKNPQPLYLSVEEDKNKADCVVQTKPQQVLEKEYHSIKMAKSALSNIRSTIVKQRISYWLAAWQIQVDECCHTHYEGI
ncbi:hypothetical protein [Vibrio viridaestus]|uniref:Uncharacterized protein n=1 Tax=Vibrio viridaestus TaxID=2487322 RepID=A0A3N9U0T2_9VIBR|nr:hypothetical protein [Vibrio viridaestus]RQW62872.1 hypothetical protein EES38_11105 [Vibrio viridaestus]